MTSNTSNTGNILVDILSNELRNKDGKKRFIQAHLDKSFELINKKAYPEVFGDEIIDGLVLASSDSIRLIDNSLIDWFGDLPNNMTQTARVGGKNPKFKQIKADMSTYGYKLRNIPIMVLDNGDGTYTPINGRTRNEILKSFGFVNCICIVYEAAPGRTPLEIADAISKMGLKANAENDPAGDLMLADVYAEGCRAIEADWITLTGDPITDQKTVKDRVDEVCGEGIFTELKRTYVTHQILNTYSTHHRVFSYSVPGTAENWVKNSKFKDINPLYDDNGNLIKRGLKYVVVAASTISKSIFQKKYLTKKRVRRYTNI